MPKGPICCQIWNAFGIIDSVLAILTHFDPFWAYSELFWESLGEFGSRRERPKPSARSKWGSVLAYNGATMGQRLLNSRSCLVAVRRDFVVHLEIEIDPDPGGVPYA